MEKCMVFRRLIWWLGARKRRAEEFTAQLERERGRGSVLETAPDGSWYISLGFMTPVELTNSPGWVMTLYNHDGRMCIARIVHKTRTKTILLGDIVADIENKGYGSIMLSSVIKLAKTLRIREIRGNLLDSDHFDKLEHFYKKHGFQVRFNPGGVSGDIVLDLSE